MVVVQPTIQTTKSKIFRFHIRQYYITVAHTIILSCFSVFLSTFCLSSVLRVGLPDFFGFILDTVATFFHLLFFLMPFLPCGCLKLNIIYKKTNYDYW